MNASASAAPGRGQASNPPDPQGAKRGTEPAIGGRERFLKAIACQAVDRPPVWLMRQAGRVLPEYRRLKGEHSFLELVQTPALAAEVTLQPIRRFGFDAAVLFSDILVVSEAMGQNYRFREQGGIEMDFKIASAADIDRLSTEAVTERLQYMAGALKLVRSELGSRTAMLGFAGSPWTLANFMMEGGSAKEFTKAKALWASDAKLFARFLDKLTTAVADCLRLQIDAGVDAVQIFDSLGGSLAPRAYPGASARWIREIIARLGDLVPVIVFAKGTHGCWDSLVQTGAKCISVDWTLSLSDVRALLPEAVAVQGNLDPFLLTTTPERVAEETSALLESMRGRRGHIFNLGHGVPPEARLECVESLVNTVRSFQ